MTRIEAAPYTRLFAAVLAYGIEEHRRLVQAAAKGKRSLKMDGMCLAVKDFDTEVKNAVEWLEGDARIFAVLSDTAINKQGAMDFILHGGNVQRRISGRSKVSW